MRVGDTSANLDTLVADKGLSPKLDFNWLTGCNNRCYYIVQRNELALNNRDFAQLVMVGYPIRLPKNDYRLWSVVYGITTNHTTVGDPCSSVEFPTLEIVACARIWSSDNPTSTAAAVIKKSALDRLSLLPRFPSQAPTDHRDTSYNYPP